MSAPTLTENTFTHSTNKTTFYWSAGPPTGPLLIFIHGWPANGSTWKPQLLALAALGFHTIAPDTRGYGRSSTPTDPSAYALRHHVSDLLALLAHLARPKAIWLGHDWGAGLVWALAAHHPSACAGVVAMTVPYRCIDNGFDALVALSNREIYPEKEFPLAQWDYQAYHVEQPERSAALLRADVASTVKLLYRAGEAATYGKPAFTASLREKGGWFGGLESAPETEFETTLLGGERELFERMVGEFERNGFEGPNAYYLNHEANAAYAAEAVNGGVLGFPVLFVEAQWDSVCDTALSRLSEPMREYCTDLTEVRIESGHWVALEKPVETNSAIVRWIAAKLPTYFPGYWRQPLVSRG